MYVCVPPPSRSGITHDSHDFTISVTGSSERKSERETKKRLGAKREAFMKQAPQVDLRIASNLFNNIYLQRK